MIWDEASVGLLQVFLEAGYEVAGCCLTTGPAERIVGVRARDKVPARSGHRVDVPGTRQPSGSTHQNSRPMGEIKMHSIPRRAGVALVGAGTILTVPLAAAPTTAGATTTAPVGNSVVITTTGMNYKVQGTLKPGVGSITWANRDDDLHMMSMGRLKAGVTQAKLKAAAKTSDKAVTALLADSPDTTWGGPALLTPGQTETVTTSLQPGNYGLLCFVMGKDHMSHAAMGMVSILKVSGATQSVTPKASGTIAVGDSGIVWPAGFTGHGTYAVKDTGTKPHSLSLARLDKGVPLLQFLGSVNDAVGSGGVPRGGSLMSGIDALSPGQTAWITLDLSDGHYGYVSPEDIRGPQLPKQSGEFTVGANAPSSSSSAPSPSSTSSGPPVVTDGPAPTGASTNWSVMAGFGALGAAALAGGAALRRRLRRH